jgi:ParB-like chromosome segregation protein Spo0J
MDKTFFCVYVSIMTPPIFCRYTDTIDPKELVDYPGNPNKHPEKQVKALARSIARLGWRHPIVVSARSGFIVAGHCRKLAAIELGCDVPVDLQEFADEAEELAVLLVDNVISELAELDAELLEVGKEALRELEFDLQDVGFDSPKEIKSREGAPISSLRFSVLIDCESEEVQAELLQRCLSEGLSCRAILM